jgi:DNA-binding MarR family transcriptional regulator
MIVQMAEPHLPQNLTLSLDDLALSYLALFVGERVGELVLERLRGLGFEGLRESHGYVFQHLLERPRSITELARLLGVTQQAASKSTQELLALGYLTHAENSDARVRSVVLSERGWAAIRKGRAVRAELEKKALSGVDARSQRAVRAALSAMLERLGGADPVRRRELKDPARVEPKATSVRRAPPSISRSAR